MRELIVISILVLLYSFPSNVSAYDDRDDYDIDDDRLIEIYNIQDLDQIRYHLSGRSLYRSSQGCPEQGWF